MTSFALLVLIVGFVGQYPVCEVLVAPVAGNPLFGSKAELVTIPVKLAIPTFQLALGVPLSVTVTLSELKADVVVA